MEKTLEPLVRGSGFRLPARGKIGDDYETAYRNHCTCSAGSARHLRGRAVIAGACYGLLGQRAMLVPTTINRPAGDYKPEIARSIHGTLLMAAA